jgi:NADPH:quinone reductase-like Zn-dependent oxidoreductase
LTGVQALFHKTRLELPRVPEGVSREAAPWVLVYSGATSVGLFTIQLAHLWGYRVVTTTSLKNFDLVRSLGADAVIDYRDADVVQKIKDATGDTLAYGLDTFGEGSSQEACVRALGPRGGEFLVITSPDESAAKLRADVKLKCKSCPLLCDSRDPC